MHNREEIKWMPFESLFKSKEIIEEIEGQKKLQQKPILSEEEIEEIERQLLHASHTKEFIQVSYYYQGMVYHKKGIVDYLQKNQDKIYFQDHTSLYFEQILKIQFL